MQRAHASALWTCPCLHSGKEPGGESTCLMCQFKKLGRRAMNAGPEADRDARFCRILAPLGKGFDLGHRCSCVAGQLPTQCQHLSPQLGAGATELGASSCTLLQEHIPGLPDLEMCLIKVPDSKTETRTGVRWDLLKPHYPYHFWQILKWRSPHEVPKSPYYA